jgi:hypothetical protein
MEDGDPRDGGRFYEEWAYHGTPGERIGIAVTSTEIDPILAFGCWSAAGVWEPLASADDSYGTDAAADTQVGGSGECVIRVTSYHGSYGWMEPRSYTVSVYSATGAGPRMYAQGNARPDRLAQHPRALAERAGREKQGDGDEPLKSSGSSGPPG